MLKQKLMPFVLATLSFVAFADMASADDRNNCALAKRDGDVSWIGLGHDSFQSSFRTPFGAVSTEQGSVQIRFQTCANDVDTVRIRVWDDFLDREIFYTMQQVARSESPVGPIQIYSTQIPVPQYPTILYYMFEIKDGADTDYYIDDDIKNAGGGRGAATEIRNDLSSFQITVYKHGFKVADWLKGAVVYQIFPDRFNNGNTSNDPITGQDWIYGFRAKKLGWEESLCDPRSGACKDEYSNQFYGGDFAGIEQKLDYLVDLGVTVIYMNPVSLAPSNHGYDVQDHNQTDPYFGSMEEFQRLSRLAEQKGIRLVVDGSFNHTSVDHPFFDFFSRWDKNNQLISILEPGADDGSGACESPSSPFRAWYYLPDIGSPALGDDRRTVMTCPRSYANEASESPTTFEAWFGFYTLPKLRTKTPAVRNYFYEGGSNAVGPFWIGKGASGWRLDVAADVDPGATVDPNNPFWEGFRRSIQSVRNDAAIIGEEWGDASSLLLGAELDTVMNYRFRSALLDWLFDGCQGENCFDGVFEDNDSNSNSTIGSIKRSSETKLMSRLRSIQEDYPAESWHSALNLAGSHDTNRIRFLLQKISTNNTAAALKKQQLLAIFQYAYPGAPTVYYGDEVSVDCPGRHYEGTWQDDPYNRCTMPWSALTEKNGQSVHNLYRKLGQARTQFAALKHGDFVELMSNNAQHQLAFARTSGREIIVAAFNRAGSDANVKIPLANVKVVAGMAVDLVSGEQHAIENGELNLDLVPALTGKMFQIIGK
jgi:glycosidase